MSEAGQHPRDLEPIEDGQKIIEYFSEGAKSMASTLIWAKDQDWNLNSYLSLLSEADRTFYAWVPKDFDVSRFHSDMGALSTPECLFSLSLSRANLFFKAKYLTSDTAGFQFEVPQKVYKVQRRKTIRFQLPEGYSLSVEFEDPLFPKTSLKKNVIDISAGGFSFETDPLDSALFQDGLILKGVRFYIRMRSIHAEAEIKHKKVLSEKIMKVGLSFQGLSAKDVEHITAYVFDENRKFFSRFL